MQHLQGKRSTRAPKRQAEVRHYVPVGLLYAMVEEILRTHRSSPRLLRRDSEAEFEGKIHWIIQTRLEPGDRVFMTQFMTPQSLSGHSYHFTTPCGGLTRTPHLRSHSVNLSPHVHDFLRRILQGVI